MTTIEVRPHDKSTEEQEPSDEEQQSPHHLQQLVTLSSPEAECV
jgi:hypothetical protein